MAGSFDDPINDQPSASTGYPGADTQTMRSLSEFVYIVCGETCTNEALLLLCTWKISSVSNIVWPSSQLVDAFSDL